MRKPAAIAAMVAAGLAALFAGVDVYIGNPTIPSTVTCDLNATTANFDAQVTAAAEGDAICLATGDYGAWFGSGGKTLTIRAADGATPRMSPDLYDGNVTLEGLTLDSGLIEPQTDTGNVTFRNNTFTGRMWSQSTAAPSNIVFDGNSFANIDPTDVAGRLYLDGDATNCGYLVENNTFSGGGADGVRVGCRTVTIQNNRFLNFGQCTDCHVDPIQVFGGNNVLIKGNYFDQSGGDLLAAYITLSNFPADIRIEDNVFRAGGTNDVANAGGITGASTFIHNTIESGTSCPSRTYCGGVIADQGATITIRDNVLGFELTAAAGTVDHNLVQNGTASGTDFTGAPSFVGPADEWGGWLLAAGSDGENAGSDGLDVGIRPS